MDLGGDIHGNAVYTVVLQIVAKCVLSTSEISCAFVVTTVLAGHLIEEIAHFYCFYD